MTIILDGTNGITTPDLESAGPVTGTTATFTGLVTTAGQIKFPATQNASADANTLDDYEEGTFTPSFANLTLGNGSLYGYYTKVGNVVAIQFGIIFGSTTTFSATCTGVGGFPFSSKNINSSAFTSILGQAYKSGVGWTGMHAGMSNNSAGVSYPLTASTNAVITATSPYTWGANDSLNFNGTFLSA